VENTFNVATHALSSSSAKYDGTANSCPYVKNSTEVRNGIVFAVVGSAGQLGGSTPGYPHNAMRYSNISTGGSMVIEIESNRLDAKWICSDGVIRDNFTIMKDVNKTTDTSLQAGSSISLSASWIGNYNWSTGEKTRSITVNPSSEISYNVHDNVDCLEDIFNVSNNRKVKTKVFPNPSRGEFSLIIASGSNEDVEIVVTNIYGSKVFLAKGKFSQTYTFGKNFLAGVYILQVSQGENIETFKLIKAN
jgi:hypothetical protein